ATTASAATIHPTRFIASCLSVRETGQAGGSCQFTGRRHTKTIGAVSLTVASLRQAATSGLPRGGRLTTADQEALLRAREGDGEAARALIARHGASMMRTARA